jgi:hypothetical protein
MTTTPDGEASLPSSQMRRIVPLVARTKALNLVQFHATTSSSHPASPNHSSTFLLPAKMRRSIFRTVERRLLVSESWSSLANAHSGSNCRPQHSTMSMHRPLYEHIDDVERLDYYRPGGYHPIHIGDRFQQNRYRIVHKLGYGSYSTIWLARDEQHMAKYVAIKVGTADHGCKEAEILNRISSSLSSVKSRGFGSNLIPLSAGSLQHQRAERNTPVLSL